MRVIGVSGTGNGSGKTLFITRVAEAHPGRFGALKFTTVFRDGQFCPKDAQKRCACTRLHDEHQVIADEETLSQENTDTGRMIEAGLRPVLWTLARPGSHEAAYQHVRELLPDDREILAEGNTAQPLLRPDVSVFLYNPCVPLRAWKDNWQELAAGADIVIVNDAPVALGRRRPAGEEEHAAASEAVREAAPTVPRVVARLEEPLEAWAGPLLEELIVG
ncbi:MAG: hypothetical protein AAF533_13000 [Acidobacteriota bacterium]